MEELDIDMLSNWPVVQTANAAHDHTVTTNFVRASIDANTQVKRAVTTLH